MRRPRAAAVLVAAISLVALVFGPVALACGGCCDGCSALVEANPPPSSSCHGPAEPDEAAESGCCDGGCPCFVPGGTLGLEPQSGLPRAERDLPGGKPAVRPGPPRPVSAPRSSLPEPPVLALVTDTIVLLV